MKISEQWLREWVATKLEAGALAERLTLAGIEVAAVTPVAAPLKNVVVGEIVAIAPHPQADRLRVCQVKVGPKAPLTIVCGASNAAVGLLFAKHVKSRTAAMVPFSFPSEGSTVQL